ncbi:MAG TPA: protein kinase [Phycisphaerales bacterium]|nr:protein kinase [Phycisphaerales bacterium]
MSELKTIAHYAVEHELGRGGMGVVYRAVDTKLGRAVAIKSLPAEYAGDVLWRTRFEGEARTLAAINHPNIAGIYGIESDEAGTYLVLELAEGPTLSERVRVSPPGVEEALEITRQIALGLGEAHARGVVHRDLKPANVKVRADGMVKVLDFGIAKAGQQDIAVDPLAATLVQKVSPRSTVPAFLLGTPGYMSPEQARGHVITPASDVWSLGCVLYELLARRAAFGGETLADTIALTILGEPEYAALPRGTPGRVLRLVQTCLKKSAAERAVSMKEAVGLIEDSLRELSGGRVFVASRAGGASDGVMPRELGNVEQPRRALIGRGALVQRVAGALKSRRIVTVAGPSGSGVSSVLHAAAWSVRDITAGGAWWVPVPAGCAPSVATVLIALAMNVRGRGGGVEQELIERIGTRDVLLVIDDAGPDLAPVVEGLLRACPNLRVLCGGSRALHIPGEEVVVVMPMEDAAPGATAAHFLERVAGPEAGAWRERPQETARVCAVLRGSPQAVELAAGLAGTMTPSQFEAQLRQRAAMAGVTDLAAFSAERVLQAVAAWAVDVQQPANLAVLLRASVFAGRWSVRAMRAMSGAAAALARRGEDPHASVADLRLAEQLERLGQAGLVRRVGRSEDPTQPVFELPRAVRREAEARLMSTPGAAGLVRRAHEGYVRALLELGGGELDQTSARRLEPELAELHRFTGVDQAEVARVIQLVLRRRGLAG